MKVVPVQEAVGMVLCHDVTQIIPGKFKGPLFKKGHIIKEEDIPELLNIGKENIYVWDMSEGYVHEDDAAYKIAKSCSGVNVYFSTPKEGKVEILSGIDGLLKVNKEGLLKVNTIDDVIVSTLHTNQMVKKDKVVAGTRIIPLVTKEDTLTKVEEACSYFFPVIEVKPLIEHKVGVVTTGSEVYHGRIKDKFGPVVSAKFESWGSKIMGQVFVSDSVEMIINAIGDFIGKGADMVVVTGGMSVDPDDVTPAGIRAAGGQVITYGSPVLPGAMFMLAYIGNVPVMGLPGCVMYSKTSIFDLIAPRVLAGERISRTDIVSLAHGGLCLNCKECRYPDCAFGKGS